MSGVGSSSTVVVFLIYRPSSVAILEVFFSDLTRCQEIIALYKCQVVIAGDFNIHVEKTSDSAWSNFLDLVTSFDCVQNVPLEPTHRDGETIDLVITKSDHTLDNLKIDPPGVISDHSLVSWNLPFHQHHQSHPTERLEGGKNRQRWVSCGSP